MSIDDDALAADTDARQRALIDKCRQNIHSRPRLFLPDKAETNCALQARSTAISAARPLGNAALPSILTTGSRASVGSRRVTLTSTGAPTSRNKPTQGRTAGRGDGKRWVD